MEVTIPVMAKARIDHFAEAQVLKALGGREGPRTRAERAGRGAVGPGPGADELHSGRRWTNPFQLNNEARNVWVGPRG
jgi:hypothetical protein